MNLLGDTEIFCKNYNLVPIYYVVYRFFLLKETIFKVLIMSMYRISINQAQSICKSLHCSIKKIDFN